VYNIGEQNYTALRLTNCVLFRRLWKWNSAAHHPKDGRLSQG